MSAQLVKNWTVDYKKIVGATTNGACYVHLLTQELPYFWLRKYQQMTSHETNVLRIEEHGFTYIYDWYSQFEVDGRFAYDPKTEDRLVGAFGASRSSNAKRDVSRQRSWVGPTVKRFGIGRNKGHFIANAVGGGLELNVFDQCRHINLGRSERGKVYRRMERYCADHPGTFFFTRPFYGDNTSRPVALEFGIVMPDNSLWIEQFKN